MQALAPTPATQPCALVTGASSGIGAAYARALAQRGEHVVLLARRAERLHALAAELPAGAAQALALDLTAPGALDRLEAELGERGLHVDLLVNNAGAGDTAPFAEQDEGRLRQLLELNLVCVVMLTRRLLPGMLRRGRGRIVNVVSTAAFQPVPFLNVYAASKAGLLSFTEALAEEVRSQGVRVQALCPGPTATEFFEVARTPHGLWSERLPRATPEEVVRASLRGLERGRLRVVPRWPDRLLGALARLAPPALGRKVAAALYRPR